MTKIAKVLILTVLAAAFPHPTLAATLSMSPAAPTTAAGNTFTLVLYVSSPGEAINAVSARLSYPSDLIEAVSTSKSGTILTLWAEEPSISGVSGTVSFEGIVPNPGYTGSGGRLLAITFRAKAPGTAKITYASGAVLANDGQGTNVFTASAGSTVTITGSGVSSPGSASPPRAPSSSADATPPLPFTITFRDGAVSPSFQPTIQFRAMDTGSGVDRYVVRVGRAGEPITLAATQNTYTLPPQETGPNVVTVTAYDRRGNSRLAVAGFYVRGELEPGEDEVAPSEVLPEEPGKSDSAKARDVLLIAALVVAGLVVSVYSWFRRRLNAITRRDSTMP